jgi:hypothetical protein
LLLLPEHSALIFIERAEEKKQKCQSQANIWAT